MSGVYFEGWGDYFLGWGTVDVALPVAPPASTGGGGGGFWEVEHRDHVRAEEEIRKAIGVPKEDAVPVVRVTADATPPEPVGLESGVLSASHEARRAIARAKDQDLMHLILAVSLAED